MKYPRVGEAFYAYLKIIADKYPDFNGNPPPMTASKQEHIVSTLPPLFQFIKETYIINDDYTTTCLPVHILYATYTSYCISSNITPLSKVVVARTLSSELNMTSNVVKINGKYTRVYNLFRKTLYEKYLIQIGIDIPNKQKKSPPPVPSKSEQEETEDQPVASESVENLIDNFITELNTLISPSAKSEQEPEVEEEPEIVPELYGIPGPSIPAELSISQEVSKPVQKVDPDPMLKINTAKYWEWLDKHKYDYIKPWYKNSCDEMIDELYSTAKECWAKYIDEDDPYNWDMLLAELEEFDKIPGCWTTNEDDTNLFSLLDHYDESQMPDNIGDPERFDNFIIYMRDSPAVSGGCGDTNDCLYQCLKMAYGTYLNMPQTIEKSEYIKDYLI
ncbi:hypothetical protein RclHR1_25070004 [Rhizophagus clarus]|uniref:Uncharacterized protein n=1 Tax=Rhizophagus clarus TaxID=94130 RepID=A0A2Z6QZ43_9GLOM|nr:hypothetical protein RclHR1_25070004 [Rhizophagus clarus]